MRPARRPVAAALALALLGALAAPTRADVERGLQLLHRARAAAQAGDLDAARELVGQARIEWPGSPLVAHELGDLLLDAGAFEAALTEYRKGSGPPHAFRAAFQSGVTRHRAAEQELAAAGVPADPQALGEVADPGPLLAAIDAAEPQLRAARRDFLEALASRDDEPARESVAALTRRLDELQELRERLQDQQQQQDQQGEDSQPSEQPQQPEDRQDEPDDEAQDDEQPGDEGPPEDEPTQDEPDEQEQEPPSPDEQDTPPDDGDTPPGQRPPPPPAEEPRELTPQELQQLLQQLDELAEEARRLEAMRRAANRRSVEKDW